MAALGRRTRRVRRDGRTCGTFEYLYARRSTIARILINNRRAKREPRPRVSGARARARSRSVCFRACTRTRETYYPRRRATRKLRRTHSQTQPDVIVDVISVVRIKSTVRSHAGNFTRANLCEISRAATTTRVSPLPLLQFSHYLL